MNQLSVSNSGEVSPATQDLLRRRIIGDIGPDLLFEVYPAQLSQVPKVYQRVYAAVGVALGGGKLYHVVTGPATGNIVAGIELRVRLIILFPNKSTLELSQSNLYVPRNSCEKHPLFECRSGKERGSSETSNRRAPISFAYNTDLQLLQPCNQSCPKLSNGKNPLGKPLRVKWSNGQSLILQDTRGKTRMLLLDKSPNS